jgi:hypothetical protein
MGVVGEIVIPNDRYFQMIAQMVIKKPLKQAANMMLSFKPSFIDGILNI